MSKATCFVQRFDWVSRALILCSLLYLVPIAVMWMRDTTPPLTMQHYTVTPAPPGGTLRVRADVERAVGRNCSAEYSRVFVDSAGQPQPIQASTKASADAAARAENRMPGKLFFSVPLSLDTAPGTGTIITEIEYVCNPWHWGYPIVVPLIMQAEVLQP